MPKIKNKLYKQFLEQNYLEPFTEQDLIKGLNNIKSKYLKEARSLIILLYYTGARPNEVLRLVAADIYKDNKNHKYLVVKIPSSKKGITRKLEFKLEKPLIKEVYTYAIGLYGDMFLFYHFMSKSTNLIKLKSGEIKEYADLSNKFRFHFKKWFPEITPYFFRHNRFTKNLEAGATIEEIRIMKGAKDFRSVFPYSHMSKTTRRKLANITD